MNIIYDLKIIELEFKRKTESIEKELKEMFLFPVSLHYQSNYGFCIMNDQTGSIATVAKCLMLISGGDKMSEKEFEKITLD
jgi:hypothetical protein